MVMISLTVLCVCGGGGIEGRIFLWGFVVIIFLAVFLLCAGKGGISTNPRHGTEVVGTRDQRHQDCAAR